MIGYIDHCLSSWFGISSVSLQWFTSYLSSRTSIVGISPHSSPSSPLTYGVRRGSVLGPVLYNLYTTPLSSIISASSVSHLLYADDTQLIISFVPQNFTCHKQPSVHYTLISSWMSSNYLTLNLSKTEFLLIGLTQQTSKIVNLSLFIPSTKPIMPSLSAKNLGFIFDSTLSFSKHISLLLYCSRSCLIASLRYLAASASKLGIHVDLRWLWKLFC